MAADVCIHIGLPKTGTTTIQAALDASSPALGTCGVLVPGDGHGAHRRATFDLIGQRVAGEHNVIPGAFDSLMEEVRGYPGTPRGDVRGGAGPGAAAARAADRARAGGPRGLRRGRPA